MAGNLSYADTEAVYTLTAYRKKNALTTNYGQVSNLSVVVVCCASHGMSRNIYDGMCISFTRHFLIYASRQAQALALSLPRFPSLNPRLRSVDMRVWLPPMLILPSCSRHPRSQEMAKS